MKPALLAVLCALTASAQPSAEAEKAARLESRVETALERMLGPGRAALTVELRGERSVKRETSSINGTVEAVSGSQSRGPSQLLELPGYTKPKSPKPSPAPASTSGGSTVVHVLTEQTEREEPFAVSGVRAWLVLDADLDETLSAEAARVAGEMLALDPGRGDELTVIRTAFRPAWRAAFSRPADARLLMLALLAAGCALGAAFVASRGAARAAAAVADALRDRGPLVSYAPMAPPPPPPPAPAPRPGSPRRIELLPPLGDARTPGEEDAA